MEMAAKGGIRLEHLPPTESAAINHSMRVHQQTVVWESLASNSPNLLQWGWKEENQQLTPIPTDR